MTDNNKIEFVNNGELNLALSLLNNPIITFKNEIGATKESINAPITYKDSVVGLIVEITEDQIKCKIWDKYVKFCPEFNSIDGEEPFKLCGIDISLPIEEINKQLGTENYIAVEMYKQFMKDNMEECAKVRKQILKKQEVDYFKNNVVKHGGK